MPDTETEARGDNDTEERSYWSWLALVGAMSLCCIGFLALAGGATLVGGAAVATTAVTGAVGGIGGALVIGLTTTLPLLVIGLFLYRRAHAS